MSDVAAPPLPPGERLAHYRLEALVGQGAMGLVYRAHDVSLDRTVGVKVLRPEVGRDARFVARFVREARAAARVSHPNIAPIHFVGEQDGRHFFAMEFVDGIDLEARVARDGPLSLAEAVDVLVQAAHGLAAAHQAGVVHRDVKPSNLLIGADGRVRVTDFGLARSLDADVEKTHAGAITGTPAFMAPEQMRGADVDARTDVYALGLTAFFVLAGRRPYESESLGALVDEQLNRPLPSACARRPDLPAEVDDVLARMCAKDPAGRPLGMAEVVRLFEALRPRPVLLAPLAARASAALLDLVVVLAGLALVEVVFRRALRLREVFETLPGWLAAALAFVGYHVGMEGRWGWTLGKRAMGLAVAPVGRARLHAPAALLRVLLRYPSVLWEGVGLVALHPVVALVGYGLQTAAVAGGILAYALAQGRTLSDLLTRTRVVVVVEPAPPEDA